MFWPVRWVTAALFRRDNVRLTLRTQQSVSAESIVTYQQALDYVGLDFRFEQED